MRIIVAIAVALVVLVPAGCASMSAPTSHDAYRALGTEPFWAVTVAHGRLTYTSPEGGFSVPAPTPHTTFNGHRYETRRIVLDISHARCSDGMSDRVYPDRVVAIVDGRELRGCGGAPLAPATLAGTSWRIVAIDGQAVGGDAYVLRFEEGRLSGRAGCNSFSGAYRVAGDRLSAGPLVATRMACAGARMAHEQGAMRVLDGTARVTRPDGDTLVLTGNGGEIRLRRAI